MLIATAVERPDLWARAAGLDHDVWPEYNRHGYVLNRYWGRLEHEFPEYQFVLYDEDADELVAQGHALPFRWDGTPARLPSGIDGLVVDAFDLRAGGAAANALAAIAVEIPPRFQGRRLSGPMLEGMRKLASDHGLGAVVAPVRPSWKERYPLTPIER
jgi:hypothetical protein